jgi:hypothetical protein
VFQVCRAGRCLAPDRVLLESALLVE